MRILAIRGQNLASLKTFELDLEALDDGGLFAITGPTGAGKSTLLDALCLALYNKTPRLDGKSNLRVGRGPDDPNHLGATDVRTILRRGATQGFAEVDFVGQDGGHYRARWRVHRARNQPNGKLQDETLTLSELPDGQTRHGATKTETLKIIEEKIGLSFDQFRRSVLLAQGEFDAFLRAPVEQRGLLLERMTGTDIYRRLSKGAHEKEKTAREALDRLLARVADRPVLDDAGRAALESRLVAAGTWLLAAEHRREVVAENLRWYAEFHAREARLGSARAGLLAAEARWHEAAPRRSELARVQAAEPLRGRVVAADGAHQRAAAAQTAAQQAEEALQGALDGLEAHRLRATQAAADLEATRQSEASARPALNEARRLDGELAAATRRRDVVFQQAEAALQTARQAEEALSQARRTLADLDRDAAQATAWLADRPRLDRLCDQWDRWQAELGRWAGAVERERKARQQVRAANEAANAAESGLPSARARAEAAEAAWQAAVVVRDTAQAAAERDLPSAAQRALQNLAQVRENLNRLEGLAERIKKSGDERHALLERARQAYGSAQFARAQAETIDGDLRSERAHLAEAERSLEVTRAVLGLAEHRAQLVEGEPCPLCGATEHPGVNQTSKAVEQAHADRVRKLKQKVSGLEQDLTRLRTEADAADKRGQQSEEDARQRQDALLGIEGDWAIAAMGASLLSPPENAHDPAASRMLARCRDDLDVQTEAARLRLAEAEAREAAWKQAHKQAEGARAEHDTTQAALHTLERSGQAAAQARETAEADRAREARTRVELEGVLTEALGDPQWLEAAERDPGAYIAECTRTVGECRQVRERRDRALANAQTQRAEVERRSDRASQATLLARQQSTELATMDGQLRGLRQQRSDLLGGRPADAVEAELAQAVRTRQDASARATTALNDALLAVEGARTRRDVARQDRDAAHTAAGEAAAALSGALAETSMEIETLRALLAYPPAWIQAEATALAEVESAVQQAQAIVAERETDCASHAAHTPPWPEPHLIEERGRVAASVEAFKQAQVQLQARRHTDDQARLARAGLAHEIGAAEAEHARWQALDALIGSGDGKALSNFAQSLTLEAVLGHANHHLHDLHRRYQLMRVPNEDLALQVIDRDMGEEIRSLQSLSGGETFLVSLALALGLASLVSGSDRDLRIESLFIDEGFGSLDAETLDKVVEALYDLQATGRQVGIISHVPGLDERIGVMVKVEPKSAGLSEVTVVRS